MRRGRDNGFLYDTDGTTLIGVDLGSDHVSEHEWGIKGTQDSFGIQFTDNAKLGLEKRSITKLPPSPDFTLVKKKNVAVLYFRHVGYVPSGKSAETEQADSIKHAITQRELTLYDDHTLATAWDEDSFGVHATDPKQIAALEEIYEAFQRKDGAIWLGGGGNPFQNAGLVLAIVSRVPKDKAEGMRAVDEDRIKLLASAANTKLEAQLKAAGKSWFALSPRWAADTEFAKEKDKTAYDVVFWLNPREQDIHNSGWFTVEQLRQWAENKGPVMGGRRERERRT